MNVVKGINRRWVIALLAADGVRWAEYSLGESGEKFRPLAVRSYSYIEITIVHQIPLWREYDICKSL